MRVFADGSSNRVVKLLQAKNLNKEMYKLLLLGKPYKELSMY